MTLLSTSSHSSVAECLPGVWEFIGLTPVGDPDFSLSHACVLLMCSLFTWSHVIFNPCQIKLCLVHFMPYCLQNSWLSFLSFCKYLCLLFVIWDVCCHHLVNIIILIVHFVFKIPRPEVFGNSSRPPFCQHIYIKFILSILAPHFWFLIDLFF